MSIEIVNIKKSFGRTQVLNDISLDIPSGQMVALLGPSGSGKTTLLRIIAGLENQSSGHIRFHGTDVSRVHARDRKVGFVFQHYALFRHMTVFENIAFGLTVLPRRERPNAAGIKAKVTRLLEMVQLAHLADRYPAQLSGGQKQRVALARALAVEPQILLLDEPFGALDAQVRKELRRWLRTLHDELDVTSIFVTHDQEEALEVADRVVVINKGKIEQEGSPQEVWENPASPFVYGFLGDVNLFKGRAKDGVVVLEEGMQLESDDAKGDVEQDAFAYVRPHDLEVQRYSPGQNTDGNGRTTGLVVQLNRALVVGPIARLELIAAEDNQAGDNAESEHVIEAHIPATQFREMGLREGETLVVTPRRAKVFLDEAAGI